MLATIKVVEQQYMVIRYRMKLQLQCQTLNGLNHLLTWVILICNLGN